MQPPPTRARMVVAETNLRGIHGLTLDGFGSLLEGGPARVPAVLERIAAGRHAATGTGSVPDAWRTAFRKHVRTEPFLAFREVLRRTFREMFQALGISNDVDECIDAALDEYRRAKAYPEVAGVLRELEREVPLAVISNMDTKALLEALHANGLAFTFVITSDEEQRYKPDSSLFRRAVRYLGLPPAHIVHVGDSYAEDILGASAIGMPALLIRRDDGLPDEPNGEAKSRVRDLREVRDFIRTSWQKS